MRKGPKKTNPDELRIILSNYEKRREFIDEYLYFALDGNSSIYKKYIDANFKSSDTGLLVDLMELSIKISYFSSDLFKNVIRSFSGKRFWFRLTVLDYIFSFQSKINREQYLQINADIFHKVANFEIRFQAGINLYAVENKYETAILKLISIAAKMPNHHALYRMAFFLGDRKKSSRDVEVKRHFIKTIKNKHTMLPIRQKKDIFSIIA
jgi:hypothetical protein